MKLFKSLLLASATGLVAVSGASAADLGAKKPSPVEYVKACYNPLWGTSGGFVIPGTQTCVRVFGQARFDYAYAQQFQRTSSPSGFRGGGIVGLDAITPSEFGNVRAFAQIGLVYRTGSGNQRTGTGTRQGTFIDGFSGAFGGNAAATSLAQGGTEVVFSGFIQFAGITAGRTASFFDPFFVPEIIGTTFRSSPGNVNLIAYTAALGNGLTATVSVEDPTVRKQPVIGSQFDPVAGPIAFGVGNTAITLGSQVGTAVPHFVGAIQLDQAWGSAKISGVLTNLRPAFTIGGPGSTYVIPGLPAAVSNIPSTKYGYAVMGALKINLPMIAAGDNFVVTGAYGEGALNYITSNFFGGSTANNGIGAITLNVGDATVNLQTGSFRLTKAWSVAGGFQHFWTPQLSSTIFGSYAMVDQPGTNPINTRDSVRDANYWSVGGNTIWQPVRGLNIAAEAAYVNVNSSGRSYDINRNSNFAGTAQCATTAVFPCRTKSSDGQFLSRLRITRDF
jgi:hypothetical protein